MRELIKRTFNLWCEKRWLKAIDRSIDRYRKTKAKANREHHVMTRLVERYNELYKGNLLGGAEDGK
jgi:hypothetical protein